MVGGNKYILAGERKRRQRNGHIQLYTLYYHYPTRENRNKCDPTRGQLWISDHALVVCRFPSQSFAAWNVERTIRPWKKVDRSALRDALMSTALCSEVETSRGKSADQLFDLYDDTLRRIADNFAPASNSTHRIRRLSPWFDSDCRSERRRTRLLERRYRKSRSDGDRTAWVEQMRSMHALYERKENLYWTTCIANEAGNPKRMWNSVSAVLRRCKDPSVQPSCLTADILSKFFKDKTDAVRMETDKADPPTYSSYSGDEFSGFREYSMEEIRAGPDLPWGKWGSCPGPPPK